MDNKIINKEIPTINNIKLKKIKLKMDIGMLNAIIAFLYKDSKLKTLKVLKNIYTLFNNLDYSIYKDSEDLLSRIWVIRKSLEARLYNDFINKDMIIQYCKNECESNLLIENILDNIDDYKISYDESKYLITAIDDRVRYGYTMNALEEIKETINNIEDGNFKSYKAVSEDLYDVATSIINIKRNTNSLDSDSTFSLRDDYFENSVTEAVEKLRDKNRVFVTGIKYLNVFLSPGYQSKRLYTYLAFPGGGKSQILLKSALDIKKYNPDVKAKDPDKIPAILFITMENDIDETIERLYNMKVSNEDIRNYTPKQIIRKLKEDGEMTLSDKNNIDIIIKYYPNRSIDTSDLYGIIKDLYDDGSEVICLILDYLKRIRPAEKAATEKEELKNITNELKTLAKKLDIPVITAQQLNRTAASVVDSALQNNKADVTKLVGRDAIAGAWEIQENSDVTIIINQEIKSDSGDLYLTFKLLKRRYKPVGEGKLSTLDYFNHPYDPENSIKLIDDIDMPKSISLFNLGTQFSAFDQPEKKKSKVTRMDMDDMYSSAFDSFDESTNIN